MLSDDSKPNPPPLYIAELGTYKRAPSDGPQVSNPLGKDCSVSSKQ
jgi:hypothetical protein